MFKKIFMKMHTDDAIEVEAIETYVVKWTTFYGVTGSLCYFKPRYQAFVDYDIAKAFMKQIKDAYKLIGVTECDVHITVQKNGL